MKLEVGKRYRRRSGEVSGPVAISDNRTSNYPITTHPYKADGYYYRDDGGWNGNAQMASDLMEEVPTEVTHVPATSGVRLDSNKPRWSLLPLDAVGEVVKVFTFGAAKYSDNNWRLPGIRYGQHYSAAMRHLASFWEGEEKEGESKLYHLAHACCDILMLLASTLNGYGTDDRPRSEKK